MIGDWKMRHQDAVNNPTTIEKPIVNAIKSWHEMAEQHGLDYVNRGGWAAMGEALRTYLNYDWGNRLDMGTLDKIICELLVLYEYDPDISEWKSEDEA